MDGKLDKSMALRVNEAGFHSVDPSATIDHLSLLQEPGSVLLDFIALDKKNKDNKMKVVKSRHVNFFVYLFCQFFQAAEILAQSIVTKLTLDRLADLKAIGCDGENKNTGWQAGAIKHIEDKVGKHLINLRATQSSKFSFNTSSK